MTACLLSICCFLNILLTSPTFRLPWVYTTYSVRYVCTAGVQLSWGWLDVAESTQTLQQILAQSSCCCWSWNFQSGCKISFPPWEYCTKPTSNIYPPPPSPGIVGCLSVNYSTVHTVLVLGFLFLCSWLSVLLLLTVYYSLLLTALSLTHGLSFLNSFLIHIFLHTKLSVAPCVHFFYYTLLIAVNFFTPGEPFLDP
jgi:hypothetical protein